MEIKPFDLEAWKRQWTANANRSEENQMRDSGWSASTAHACTAEASCLLHKLAQLLAGTPTEPGDFFDRPTLVQAQEAARHIYPEA